MPRFGKCLFCGELLLPIRINPVAGASLCVGGRHGAGAGRSLRRGGENLSTLLAEEVFQQVQEVGLVVDQKDPGTPQILHLHTSVLCLAAPRSAPLAGQVS